MAGTARVAGAYLDVRPELSSDFVKEIQTAFAKAFARVESEARASSARIEARMRADFESGARGLSTGVDRYWRDSEGKLRDGLGRFVSEAKNAGGDAGAGLTDGMEGGIEGGQAGPQAAVAAIAVGAVAALAAAGVQAGQKFMDGVVDAAERERTLDQVAASLGLTPEQAQEYGRIAGNLYAGAWGDSHAEVATALGDVASSLRDVIPTEDLERATALSMDLADTFELSAGQIAHAGQIMLSEGMVSSWEEAYDVLTVGLQNMPAAVRDELLEASNEYSKHVADLGITSADFVGMLAEASEGGVYMVDKTGDALKELTIRATDMSAASVEAYQKAGLNAEDMAGRFLEGGDTARGALKELTDGLLGIEDPVERANAAVALFGTPLEDLSVTEIPDFLQAVGSMDSGLGDVEGAAGDLSTTLNDNTITWWESIKRNFSKPFTDWFDTSLNPLLRDFATAFSEGGMGGLVDKVREKWPEIKAGLSEWWAGVVQWAKDNGPAILQGIADGIQAGAEFFSETLLPALSELLVKFGDWFQETAWPYLKEHGPGWIAAFLAWLGEIWLTVHPALMEFLGVLAEWILTDGIPWLFEEGKKLGEALWEWIAGPGKDWALEQLGALVDHVLEWLKNDAPGLIKSAADGMWDGLVSAFKGALNLVIEAWNDLEMPAFDYGGLEVQGVTIIPSFSTPPVDLFPHIPKLHSGGVFRAPVGQAEGLALLRDNEVVFTPEDVAQWDGGGHQGPPPMVHVTSYLGTTKVQEEIRRGQYQAARAHR